MRPTHPVWPVVAVCLLGISGCSRRPAFRPRAELSHGARAVVPWGRIELDAVQGRARRWTLPLRNPVEIPVVLEAPRLAGCNQCLTATWDAPRAAPDGAVRLAPGESPDLVLDYSGLPTPDLSRFVVEFEVP